MNSLELILSCCIGVSPPERAYIQPPRSLWGCKLLKPGEPADLGEPEGPSDKFPSEDRRSRVISVEDSICCQVLHIEYNMPKISVTY